MKFDLLVKNGMIVTAGEIMEADLAVKDGKIAAIIARNSGIKAAKEYDASGKHILPGGIDVHVHGGYGQPHRETGLSITSSAAAGGITTFIDMPQSVPIIVTGDRYKDKIKTYNDECIVDFALWGGLVAGHFDDLEGMYKEGGQAFKVFMCRTDNFPMANDGYLLKSMKQIGQWGGMVCAHAENDTLMQQLIDDFAAEGRTDVEAYIKSYPPYTEEEAIQRLIFLAKQAPKCKVHLAHLSIPEGAELIKRAKASGIDITAETTPHYLALNVDDLREQGGVAKCDPPLRTQEYVDKLWEYVIDGTIDMIASDHSPQTFDMKFVAEDEFHKASQGMPGIQTGMSVVLTEGVHKRNMSLNRFVEITSLNPAKRFGLYPQKGSLAVGSDADFIILDLDKEYVCKAEDMHYVNKHTVYDNKTLKGYIEKTFVRGNLICDNNKIKAEKGFGTFIPMEIGDKIE